MKLRGWGRRGEEVWGRRRGEEPVPPDQMEAGLDHCPRTDWHLEMKTHL